MENISNFPHAFLSKTSQIYIYIPYYLLSLIVLVSFHFKLLTASTKIKHQLDFYEMSGIYLDMKARVHNVYFDTTKL